MIVESMHILPAGLWKGSALALALDLAAGILSGGNTTRKIGELKSETDLSQVFIVVDIERHMTLEQREKLMQETLDHMKENNEHVRYPGQRSQMDRNKHLKKGVNIPDNTWSGILKL